MNPAIAISVLMSVSTPQSPVVEAQGSTARVSESVERWVAFPSGSGEDIYSYGFLYVDEQAGFTWHLAGKFSRDKTGHLQKLADDTIDKKASFKLRIDKNGMVNLLSEGDQKQLGLPDRPDWMKFYDDGSNSVHHRTRLGFWCNQIGDPGRALTYLESAYREDPAADGLAFELSYAYNALNRFDEAASVLSKAVERNPKDVFLGSELAYTYLSTGKNEQAVELYLRFIAICPDDNDRKSEMAMNLGQAYKRLGDTKNSEAWMAKAKAWAREGSPTYQYFHPGS